MKTRVTELFGIEYPIACGGMFFFGEPKLCAAVSNAGGLGNLTSSNYRTEADLREAIQQAKALTDKPFSVTITMLPEYFSEPESRYYYDVCCEEKVAVIETSGMSADRYVDQVHAAGIKLVHKVGSVRHAKHAAKAGYDALYAVGFEEGGHPLSDNVTTMVLVQRIVDSVDIPVLAAGGIADGRGLAAALALGAEGVMMATRFLLTHESSLNQSLKNDLMDFSEVETSIIGSSLGLQARALNTDFTNQIRAAEAAGEDIETLLSARNLARANELGDINGATWGVGQSIGLVNGILSCSELLQLMAAEAKQCLHKASAYF